MCVPAPAATPISTSALYVEERTPARQGFSLSGKEINTTGDGFLACFDGPARAIRCALATAEATRALGMDLHLGLHTGTGLPPGEGEHGHSRCGRPGDANRAVVSVKTDHQQDGAPHEGIDGQQHECCADEAKHDAGGSIRCR
jgi:hypothetical protein